MSGLTPRIIESFPWTGLLLNQIICPYHCWISVFLIRETHRLITRTWWGPQGVPSLGENPYKRDENLKESSNTDSRTITTLGVTKDSRTLKT